MPPFFSFTAERMVRCLFHYSSAVVIRAAVLLSFAVVVFQLKLMANQNTIVVPAAADLFAPPEMMVNDKISFLPTGGGNNTKNNNNIGGQNNNDRRRRNNNCPFRDSSIVESIYVYPHPGSPEWKGDILSDYAIQQQQQHAIEEEYPWIGNDLRCKTKGTGPYDTTSQLVQYNTELLVRDIIAHPDSCLRTHDPEKATLFYVPYLPSAEFHNGSLFAKDTSQSPYGAAIQDILTRDSYEKWETQFGLTPKYWKRRGGSDHVLVFSEPMHGLWHPKSRRGNFHFLHSQFQTHPPIVVSNELSKTFVDMYPMCARKNILVPYPNTDGRWFNGRLDDEIAKTMTEHAVVSSLSAAAIPSEQELLRQQQKESQEEDDRAALPSNTTTTTARLRRILGYYYTGGNHGTCTNLRKKMQHEFKCSPSGRVVEKHKKAFKNYAYGYRQATFCPCPGGDSPSAKRNFDALLAGCIPVILSEDFVWPYTAEFDRSRSNNEHHHNKSSGKTASFLLDPDDFSVRLNAADHENSISQESCTPLATKKSLQSVLEEISSEELARLRRGVAAAADAYSYYRKRPDLPDNPLREGILPDGGAAHALVRALEERASGALWDACREEIKDKDIKKDRVKKFKC